MNTELIKEIRDRALELDRKSNAVVVAEGLHRCSTDDDYYRGGADALRELADDLQQREQPPPSPEDSPCGLLSFTDKVQKKRQEYDRKLYDGILARISHLDL